MNWIYYLLTGSVFLFLLYFIYFIWELNKLGKPHDYARASGSSSEGIRYSFTGAMNPKKKESAFLHVPTYVAGIIYHLGSFLSIFLIIVSVFSTIENGFFSYLFSSFLIISVLSGAGLLIKRISLKKMRGLSVPDDYISNLIITGFQLSAFLWIHGADMNFIFYLMFCLVLLYFPLGKLKHAFYFFAARYQLGLFYGSRGVWPPKI